MNCKSAAVPRIPRIPQRRSTRKQLEHLYHRRSAVEMLIRSLEQYDRCRERGVGKRVA